MTAVYALAFKTSALKEWQRLDKAVQTQFKKTLAERLQQPHVPSSKLAGLPNAYKIKLRATGSPFDSKDKLKARGYRWDGEGKVWYCNLGSEAALADELAWLKAEVYGARRAQVEVEGLDALTRYSQRTGRAERREIQTS